MIGGASLWHDPGLRPLMVALLPIKEALLRHVATLHGQAPPPLSEEELGAQAQAGPEGPDTLRLLCRSFDLSAFERDLLLLCLGVQLDVSLASHCAAALGDPQRTLPVLSLAMAVLGGGDVMALSPKAPLRRFCLIEVHPGSTLLESMLRIEERVLYFLLGVSFLDERLRGLCHHEPAPVELFPSHQVLAHRIARLWGRPADALPLIQLCGGDPAGLRAVAAQACALLGMQLHVLGATDVPVAAGEREALCRLWQREALLGKSALLLDCTLTAEGSDSQRAALSFAEQVGMVVLAGNEPLRGGRRPTVRLDALPPSTLEQHVLWRDALGMGADQMDEHLSHLAAHFTLGSSEIRAARAQALDGVPDGDMAAQKAALWDACRGQSRPRLSDLAQPIEPAASWDDLVLPEEQVRVLREIVVHVRQRAKVYLGWGFARKSLRGLGISALFAGSSGTGKTMAAEVLAGELRLDLYRIDLSQVISKYIGETEKNLRRVFDAAEAGGAILLFDEADAIFGKRSEVKDSHDRYANIEVSYLLQRMEAYRGLAILTTNMKSALDTAFLRRIRFIVHFPFPDGVQRAEIWRRAFPPSTPTEQLDVGRLARLNVAGGTIRNIALCAAFLAADAGEPVRMRHILRAARTEYAKLEKPLTEQELGGWR